MKTHSERCREEGTRDVIFLFQVRRLNVVSEPEGYRHDGGGFRAFTEGEGFDPDAEYLSDDQLIELQESGGLDPFAAWWWQTERVFLDRQEAEAWERRNSHNYSDRGVKWRVYGVNAEGALAELLKKQDEATGSAVPDVDERRHTNLADQRAQRQRRA